MENTTGRVLSPLIVRSKGRPPSKRKVHPAEKCIKKCSTKRRLLSTNEAERSSRTPDECIVSGTQQSQVWTHAPYFFATPSTAHHSQDKTDIGHMTDFHQDFSAW
ncbi:hypothetical protein F2P56_004221 [Juglans regia]|uniref:Uncharacterized protein n=1 Tax=Juglans regia TaxID=51240 RepID=A0A833Y933_JUGRE|nr:hypothetical protein F2P56_004221 [Juglans regia]